MSAEIGTNCYICHGKVYLKTTKKQQQRKKKKTTTTESRIMHLSFGRKYMNDPDLKDI